MCRKIRSTTPQKPSSQHPPQMQHVFVLFSATPNQHLINGCRTLPKCTTGEGVRRRPVGKARADEANEAANEGKAAMRAAGEKNNFGRTQIRRGRILHELLAETSRCRQRSKTRNNNCQLAHQKEGIQSAQRHHPSLSLLHWGLAGCANLFR